MVALPGYFLFGHVANQKLDRRTFLITPFPTPAPNDSVVLLPWLLPALPNGNSDRCSFTADTTTTYRKLIREPVSIDPVMLRVSPWPLFNVKSTIYYEVLRLVP